MMERIPDSDVERARARIDVILAAVATKRKGREFAGACPFHNEKTPSFYVYPDGHYHCFGCGAHGDAITFLMRHRNLDFAPAVREILQLPDLAPRQPVVRENRTVADRPDDVAVAREIWAQASAAARPRVELYFHSRCLGRAIPPTIREHPALWCTERHAELPAMVAAFKDSTSFICAVQRTWLESSITGGEAPDPKGTRVKDATKRTRGEMRDGCVRLAPPGRMLGLAEGIETGLAAMQLYNVPVWVTCGAVRMPTVWIPPEVERLVIFGDNGASGEEWAAKAVEAHGRHHATEAIFPDYRYGDFQEQLRAEVLGS